MSFKYKSFIDIILLVLFILSVALWSYLAGQMSVNTVTYDSLQDVHNSYQDITINKDGSYHGTTSGGIKVTGCIEGAKCG